MSAHTGSLLLSPSDPFLAPDRTVLTIALADAGFLGEALSGCEGAFLADWPIFGRFLELFLLTGSDFGLIFHSRNEKV